jgi:hypothetical protein
MTSCLLQRLPLVVSGIIDLTSQSAVFWFPPFVVRVAVQIKGTRDIRAETLY